MIQMSWKQLASQENTFWGEKQRIYNASIVGGMLFFLLGSVAVAAPDNKTFQGEVTADLSEPLSVTTPSKLQGEVTTDLSKPLSVTALQAVIDKTKTDYYILNTGERVSFLRRKNTYVMINDPKKTSATALSNKIQRQFDDTQVNIVTKHSMGDSLVVELTGPNPSKTVSALKGADPSISFISQVLINPDTGSELAVLPEIVIRVRDPADWEKTRAALQEKGLSLISKLAFTDQEYHFAITKNIT